VTAGLSTANQDSVLVVRCDAGQSAQIGGISVDGEDAGSDFDSAVSTGSGVQPGKLIGDSAPALPETNYH
jgi:hypothetical protein